MILFYGPYLYYVRKEIGVSKMAMIADIQYYSCWRKVGGWAKSKKYVLT